MKLFVLGFTTGMLAILSLLVIKSFVQKNEENSNEADSISDNNAELDQDEYSDETSFLSVQNNISNTKKAISDSITERHTEAADIIGDALKNIYSDIEK